MLSHYVECLWNIGLVYETVFFLIRVLSSY